MNYSCFAQWKKLGFMLIKFFHDQKTKQYGIVQYHVHLIKVKQTQHYSKLKF